MAHFSLQPCKLRGGRLVPTKDEPVSFEWNDLCSRLAPTSTVKAKMQLRSMQVGAFIGTTHSKNPDWMLDRSQPETILTNFIFCNMDRSGNVAWLLKQNPSFSDRLSEVFRVESVEWDSGFEELGSVTKAA